MQITNLTIKQLHQHYNNADFTPSDLIEYLLNQAERKKSDNSWIKLFTIDQIRPYVAALDNKSSNELPLYGIPFAIKDNIDLAGIPTTAACEAFRYEPDESAHVVQRLIEAGAIPLGKTNLDQFATGLVGVRSPFGATHNAFNPDYISGGSSSGSAVTVAQGLVSFALGTDTAGSGRVPAAFNNILGMKPTRGLLSCTGVVPACKSLDCVAIFATTTDDLHQLFNICADFDPADAYARKNITINSSTQLPPIKSKFIFAIPQSDQLKFFGNQDYQTLFSETISKLEALGGIKKEIDFTPFNDAALLLYQGPWVSERYIACQPLIDEQPQALLDVTRSIISQGKEKTAVDAFKSQYKLNACKQLTDPLLNACDFLLTPTAGTIYTIDEVNANPVEFNSNIGYYTNYMNLLDYASIAVPAGFTQDGLPFGVTMVANAYSDQRLLSYAQLLQQDNGYKLGATDWNLPVCNTPQIDNTSYTNIVVCGAHMQGLPLNHQLTERGGVLVKTCKSAQQYKLVALPGKLPLRPGMIRVKQNGAAIDIEVWRLPTNTLGSFLQGIPHPLGLGQVTLDDGSLECGFICESYIEEQSTDISNYGGWRQYLQSIT